MDRERGMFVDPAKVRTIDFKGRFFSSRGPLNTARPPQGQPVLVQAGDSPQGQDFAAKRMDAVLVRRQHRRGDEGLPRLRCARGSPRHGRDPDSCKVMFVATPTIGESDEEAWERVRRRQAHRNGRAGARRWRRWAA